jgi:peptide/nickel transport system ATP-binding protein
MTTPLVETRDLAVEFVLKRNLLARPSQSLRAVDGVSIRIEDRQTVGLVGESGSGKSTLGRGVLRLVEPSAGSVLYDGQDITRLTQRTFRVLRADMQMIFQDPYSSLDPSMVVEDIVGEPLDVFEPGLGRAGRRERVVAALQQVDLAYHHLARYPFEFSGGQRQRIAIARAIITRPRFIVCDEPVSALDVSTQSRVINLLKDLQDNLGLTYLFIAHDLEVVRAISDEIAVMYLGRIVEFGPSERVHTAPAHPYTEALLSAIPYPHPRRQRRRERIRLEGEIPSPIDPPPGCRFHTRCRYAMPICREIDPPATPVQEGGMVHCHLHTDGPKLAGASVSALSPAAIKPLP